jgi:hypothetical protein
VCVKTGVGTELGGVPCRVRGVGRRLLGKLTTYINHIKNALTVSAKRLYC